MTIRGVGFEVTESDESDEDMRAKVEARVRALEAELAELDGRRREVVEEIDQLRARAGVPGLPAIEEPSSGI